MPQLVILCEEPSAAVMVRAYCAREFHQHEIVVVEHEGISDLKSSVERKLKAWTRDSARFIILLDNDGKDCFARKKTWLSLVPDFRREHAKVRLVCQELEAWYLAEPEALRDAQMIDEKKLRAMQTDRLLRQPDQILNAKAVFRRHVNVLGQIDTARRVGPFLRCERSRSPSFRTFCATVSTFLLEGAQ